MKTGLPLFVVLLLGACGSIPGVFQSKGEQELSAGLRQYEDGAYAESAKHLQAALESGLEPKSQIDARKHLAFIYCASGRQSLCRDEFRKALDIDPKMELTAAEAGHPRWGPVFRSVKAAKR